jgi:hypothetical protein
MASPAFSFCAAVENSVQMLFIEIEVTLLVLYVRYFSFNARI